MSKSKCNLSLTNGHVQASPGLNLTIPRKRTIQTRRTTRKTALTSIGRDFFSKYETTHPLGLNKILEEIRQEITNIQRASTLEGQYRIPDDGRYYKFSEFNPKEPHLGDIYPKMMHIQISDFPFCVLVKNDRTLKTRNMVLLEGFSVNLDYSDKDRLTKTIVYSSKNAQSLGVRPGMTYSEGKTICPNLFIPQFDFDECSKVCLNFFKAIMRLTSEVEAAACDEAIVDVTDLMSAGVTKGYSTKDHLIFTIRSLIFRGTGGLTPIIGLARNRILARYAARQTNNRDIMFYFLQDRYVSNWMRRILIDELLLTRPTSLILKHKYKVSTCQELLEKGLDQFQQDFGVEMGNRLYKCASLEDGDGLRSTYWNKVTFITEDLELHERTGMDEVLQDLTRQALLFLDSKQQKAVRIAMGVTFIRRSKHLLTDCASVLVECHPQDGSVEPYGEIMRLWMSTEVKFSEVKRLMISLKTISRHNAGSEPYSLVSGHGSNAGRVERSGATSAGTATLLQEVVGPPHIYKDDELVLRECKNHPDFLTLMWERRPPVFIGNASKRDNSVHEDGNNQNNPKRLKVSQIFRSVSNPILASTISFRNAQRSIESNPSPQNDPAVPHDPGRRVTQLPTNDSSVPLDALSPLQTSPVEDPMPGPSSSVSGIISSTDELRVPTPTPQPGSSGAQGQQRAIFRVDMLRPNSLLGGPVKQYCSRFALQRNFNN